MADGDSSGARGASLLMLTQALSKLLTFMLNQLLVRLISPTLFGVSAYLDFLYSTTLFFSREAQRLSIQRTKLSSDLLQTYQSIINFGYIPLVIGIPISLMIFGWLFKGETFTEVNHIASHFPLTVLAYWGLTIIELLVEPIYSLNQYTLNFGNRSKFEAIAVFLRCITTFLVVAAVKTDEEYTRNGLLLMGFAVGQLIYSLTLCVSYARSIKTFNILSILPTKLNSGWFDLEVWKLWKISFVQMIFKQILTEGDKFLVNGFFSVEQTGVYSVMNNYGSIIVRLLFQPIEESVRLSATKTIANKERSLVNVMTMIKYLLIFYIQLSILIFLAGSFNASYLLKVLLGGKSSNWLSTDLFELFPLYICYIPFLAFNGVLEAFFSAAANPGQLLSYSYFMSGLSILILCLLYFFIENLQLGISGLILANIINMVLRIIYCSGFIIRFFTQNHMAINYKLIVSFLIQNLLIGLGSYYLNLILLGSYSANSLTDLIKSAFVCLMCLVFMLSTVRKELTPFISQYFKKKFT